MPVRGGRCAAGPVRLRTPVTGLRRELRRVRVRRRAGRRAAGRAVGRANACVINKLAFFYNLSTVIYPEDSAPNGVHNKSESKSEYLIPDARSQTQANKSVFGDT